MDHTKKQTKMSHTKRKRYKRAPDIIFRRIGDESVLVPAGGGAITEGRLFLLNEVGAFIWDLLEEMDDPELLAAKMVDNFEVDTPQAGMDLQTFLEELMEAGCVDMVTP